MGANESTIERDRPIPLSPRSKKKKKKLNKELSKIYLRWTLLETKGPSPPERYAHTMTAIGNKIYIFGGYTGNYDYELYTFNTELLLWETPKIKGNPPVGRAFHSFAVVNQKIYYFGGFNGRHNMNEILILDTDKMEWKYPRVRGAIPAGRFEQALASVGQYIFLFGGGVHSTFLNDVYVLDTDNMIWARVESVADHSKNPKGRCAHSFVYVPQAKKIFMYGGYDGVKRLKDFYHLDPDTMCWKKYQITSPGRLAAHSTCVLEDSIYILGGYSPKRGRTNDVFIFSTSTLEWFEPNVRGIPPSPRSYHSSCVVDKKIYVYGGYDGKKKSSEIFVLEQVLPTLVDLCVAYVLKNKHLFLDLSILPSELQEYFN